MIQRFINLFILIRVVRERGNWKLIRHSQKQLKEFVFCRSSLNSRSPIHAFFYWYNLLRGLDVLIWRLETFGFIFPAKAEQKARDHLNSYL